MGLLDVVCYPRSTEESFASRTLDSIKARKLSTSNRLFIWRGVSLWSERVKKLHTNLCTAKHSDQTNGKLIFVYKFAGFKFK